VVLVVFLIPHSVLGSELDYRALDTQQPPSGGTVPSGPGGPGRGTPGGGM